MTFGFARSPGEGIDRGAVLGGKYKIDELIAEGGMSFVYAAHDLTLDERVAIKLLKLQLARDPDLLARFAREAKTLRRIQSEHCVKVLEVDIDPEHGPFMVMEFLEGVTLREILAAKRKLPPRQACEFIIQVCDALAVAHTNSCIHRDIKPENIIIVRRGDLESCRLVDFGIAKHALTGSVMNQDLANVKTMSLVGTPQYMAPEQMQLPAAIDPRTDIWALAVVLYEMLAGRPPFASESVPELCSMVMRDEAPPIQAFDPSIPDHLARAVHICLAKDPDERFRNVGALAIALLPFAPRRARACLERILATLHAAGVPVDREHVSDHPPPLDAVDTAPRMLVANARQDQQTLDNWDEVETDKIARPAIAPLPAPTFTSAPAPPVSAPAFTPPPGSSSRPALPRVPTPAMAVRPVSLAPLQQASIPTHVIQPRPRSGGLLLVVALTTALVLGGLGVLLIQRSRAQATKEPVAPALVTAAALTADLAPAPPTAAASAAPIASGPAVSAPVAATAPGPSASVSLAIPTRPPAARPAAPVTVQRQPSPVASPSPPPSPAPSATSRVRVID